MIELQQDQFCLEIKTNGYYVAAQHVSKNDQKISLQLK